MTTEIAQLAEEAINKLQSFATGERKFPLKSFMAQAAITQMKRTLEKFMQTSKTKWETQSLPLNEKTPSIEATFANGESVL